MERQLSCVEGVGGAGGPGRLWQEAWWAQGKRRTEWAWLGIFQEWEGGWGMLLLEEGLRVSPGCILETLGRGLGAVVSEVG